MPVEEVPHAIARRLTALELKVKSLQGEAYNAVVEEIRFLQTILPPLRWEFSE